LSGQRRRGPTEIRYEILKAALGGQKKTRIMYQSSLNLKQLNKYLDDLVLTELIGYHPAGRYFATTDKGRTFARMFENYRETADLLSEQEKALERFLTSRAKKPVAAAP
jgi:predicted transcriptional regulator